MKVVTALLSIVLTASSLPAVQAQQQSVSVEHVMTSEELKSTGVTTLSISQRSELDRWLNRYTLLILKEKKESSPCDPAIETRIDGDFKGWEGDTIYALRNGEIWQQASYHYHYHYAYAPQVTIYPTAAGCVMRVSDDDDEAISVRRLK